MKKFKSLFISFFTLLATCFILKSTAYADIADPPSKSAGLAIFVLIGIIIALCLFALFLFIINYDKK